MRSGFGSGDVAIDRLARTFSVLPVQLCKLMWTAFIPWLFVFSCLQTFTVLFSSRTQVKMNCGFRIKTCTRFGLTDDSDCVYSLAVLLGIVNSRLQYFFYSQTRVNRGFRIETCTNRRRQCVRRQCSRRSIEMRQVC